MAKFSADSLDWLKKLESAIQMRKENPKLTGVQLAAKLKGSTAHASYLSSLSDCLDQAAIDKIHQAAMANPPFILSFNNARTLIRLNGKVADLHAAVHAALDVIFSSRLATVQIEALVEWMVKGNSPETFKESETGKKDKSDKGSNKGKNQETQADKPDDLTAQVMELADKANSEKARGDGQTAARDKLKALLEKTIEEAKKEGDSSHQEKEGKKSKSKSDAEPSLFWEWMLGVKFMSQLKAKAKKGELTTHEKILILTDKGLIKPLGWVFGNFGKLFKKMAIGLWHSVEEAAGKTVKKILAVVLPLLFIIAIVWAVLAFFHFAVISPLHWIEAKVKSGFHWGEKSDEQPASSAATPPPAASSILPVQAVIHKVPQKKTEKPVMAYQPSIAFNTSDLSPTGGSTSPINNGDKSATTLYDPKLLEQEIAALPRNCMVKSFPVLTDEGMPGDLAVSRMQGVTDPDKYTMKIGSGTEKIISINTTTTNLTINYKSTDPFNLDSAGPLNFFWEDVLYIHTDEIEVEGKTPYKFYQLSLVVSGSKVALTIQCASTDDLKHLVSTMEYFIRNSRLGHDTALAGMPYPTQGVRLTNGCLVNWLWADSPMAKAGVKLGDMVWSVEKNAGLPPEREKLEAQLGALTSGPHDLFLVSPADREKGLVLMNQSHTTTFNPKRQKVSLQL